MGLSKTAKGPALLLVWLAVVCALAFPLAAADPPDDSAEGVQWSPLIKESLLFLGIQHSFRLATEPGTREGLKGPFFGGWYDALSNLHGWGDGDPFYVNYVGHPMEGGVAGFLFSQNDPRFRNVEWGNNRRYWKSRLRAVGFAWAYSTQFEIGPLSEASIGKIQKFYPQQGFVDHIATPVLGAVWMMGEDAMDRYVIRHFEDHVHSPYLRALVRSGLNPTRTFANVLRFDMPWRRYSREGVLTYGRPGAPEVSNPNGAKHEPLPSRSFAPFELSALALLSSERNGLTSNCSGGRVEARWNFAASHAVVAQVGGCKLGSLPPQESGDQLIFSGGYRWTHRGARWSPYAQVLAGGRRFTVAGPKPGNEQLTDTEFPAYPPTDQSNGPSITVGAGLERAISRVATLRVVGVDFTHAWLPGLPVNLAHYPNAVTVTTGITLRIGTW